MKLLAHPMQAARDGKQDARTPASSLGLRQPVRASARAMPRVSDEDEDAESPAVSSRRAASASTAMEKGRSAVEELETHQLQPVPNPTQAMQKVPPPKLSGASRICVWN